MSKRKQLDAIPLEELEDNTAASGLERVLRFEIPTIAAFPAGSKRVQLNDLLLTSPDVTSPDATSPVKQSPDLISPAVSSPDDLSEDAAIEAALRSMGPSPRERSIHRCLYARDAHTASEEAIYQTLWGAGKQVRADDYFRVSQMSQAELSIKVRMSTRNLRPAIRRLVDKLAIEELRAFDPATRTARVFKVFSYDAILERRKAAGLEWVVRDKGIRFVPPATSPDEPAPDITSPDLTSLAGRKPSHREHT